MPGVASDSVERGIHRHDLPASVYITPAFWERCWRTAGIQSVLCFIVAYVVYGQPAEGQLIGQTCWMVRPRPWHTIKIPKSSLSPCRRTRLEPTPLFNDLGALEFLPILGLHSECGSRVLADFTACQGLGPTLRDLSECKVIAKG